MNFFRKRLWIEVFSLFLVTSCDKEYPFTNTTETYNDSLFSISDSVKGYFLKGNLQYDIDNHKYLLAENQWTILNKATSYTNRQYAIDNSKQLLTKGKIDLFGWGTGQKPNSATQDSYGYTAFNDWGTAAATDIGVQSRTLTADEWQYLYNSHCKTLVTLSTNDGKTVHGLLIFPDNINLSDARSFLRSSSSARNINDDRTYINWNVNIIDEKNLLKSKALFLPACGYRYGSDADAYNSFGYYWSATNCSDTTACSINFFNHIVLPQYGSLKNGGRAVRLFVEK